MHRLKQWVKDRVKAWLEKKRRKLLARDEIMEELAELAELEKAMAKK